MKELSGRKGFFWFISRNSANGEDEIASRIFGLVLKAAHERYSRFQSDRIENEDM